MSELMNARNSDLRWQLLTTVSALALLVAVYGAGDAQAADQDVDRPTLWIELGGQFDRLDDPQQNFTPPFMPAITEPGQLAALNDQAPPSVALDETAKISFQPEDSDWVFSMAVRYGRSAAKRHLHHQTPNADVKVLPLTYYGFTSFNGVPFGGYSAYPSRHVKFADGLSQQSESHAILDFMVGKDVGLGMMGSAVVSGGVRIAQFVSKSNINLNAVPDLQYPAPQIANHAEKYEFLHSRIHFHDYAASAAATQSFHGLGPQIAWNASTPVAGNDNAEIALDWGGNFSLLFGRQKASGSHQTVVNSYYLTQWGGGVVIGGAAFGTPAHLVKVGYFYGPCNHGVGLNHSTVGICAHQTKAASHNRSRMVMVPNLGGFAGLSLRFHNAKVSFGYRADEFFGAMDGGIDMAKKENRGFFGPYANISVGIP